MKDLLNLLVGEEITQDELLKRAVGEIETGLCHEEYKCFDTTCRGRILLYPNRREYWDGQDIVKGVWQFTYHSSPTGGPTTVYILDSRDKIKFKIESIDNQ